MLGKCYEIEVQATPKKYLSKKQKLWQFFVLSAVLVPFRVSKVQYYRNLINP